MKVEEGSSERVLAYDRRAHGPWSDLALRRLGYGPSGRASFNSANRLYSLDNLTFSYYL